MGFKHWIQKVLTRIVLHLGAFVAWWVGDDVFTEVIEQENLKHPQSPQITIAYNVNGLHYEQLKKIEDEWIERGIIR